MPRTLVSLCSTCNWIWSQQKEQSSRAYYQDACIFLTNECFKILENPCILFVDLCDIFTHSILGCFITLFPQCPWSNTDGHEWNRLVSNHNKVQGATLWWRHKMETFSALLAICAGHSPVTGEFPAQRPVTRSFDVLFDLRLNKRLSKQSRGWWFETPSRPLWCHCAYFGNVMWIGPTTD